MHPIGKMENYELISNKLKKYNQEQILDYIDKLDDKQKAEIEEQILKLDFDLITKLYEGTKTKQEINQSEIEPINYINKAKLTDSEKEELEAIGADIIKNNQYAIVTMAGGQGTRLGFNGPKGTFKLDIGKKGKYIFEILADTIKKSKEQYGTLPYWYIMTSIQNNDQTIEFFKEHNYFDYPKEKIKFFIQGTLPMLTPEGKMVIEDNKIKTASDGNGGVYLSLKNEKMIEDMKSKNIKWVYICGVDNIMVKPIDGIFIGLTIKNNMQIASKSVAKAYPEEKVGVYCKRNGKPSIVEYIELSEQMRTLKNESGDLAYGEANIISHLLSVDAIEKISNETLKYHLAIKNNLYKFEAFIFDGFEFLNDMLVMRVKREEEFAPIKNKEGLDSPETAKEIYERNLVKNGRI